MVDIFRTIYEVCTLVYIETVGGGGKRGGEVGREKMGRT